MSIKHAFVNPIADDPTFAGTKPSDWNADHTLGADDNLVTDAQLAIINATSGSNTGDQTITLSGDVSGSGTGAITTAIGALKVTNAMLAGSIDLTAKVTGILPSANGGTGVNNGGTLTNASNTTITGGGTLALAGYILTVPATGTAALLGTANAFTAEQSITTLNLGVTQTATSGLSLINTTAAILGAANQQISPCIRWSGQGWDTDGLISVDTSFRSYAYPHQGTSPYGVLVFEASNSGGAYSSTPIFSISSLGSGGIGVRTGDPDTGSAIYAGGNIKAVAQSAVNIYFDISRYANSNIAAFRLTPTGGLTSSNQQWWVGLPANSNDLWFAPYYQNPLTATVKYTNTGSMAVGLGSLAPGGRVHIAGGADERQLIVQAHSTQTTNLAEMRNSSGTAQLSITGVGGMIINEQGDAAGDFTAKSDSYDALFVDASENSIDIMHHASGKIGFFAQTPAVQQNYTAVSDPPTQAEVTAIRDALVNLGLMKAS